MIDGVGPVTSSVVRLFDTKKHNQWLYFGTGRYYFEQDVADDASGQRGVFGIKDPCFDNSTGKFMDSCPSPLSGRLSLSNVTNVSSVPANPDDVSTGWYINFAGCTDATGLPVSCDSAAYRAEREITDPLATTQGVVFFTSFKPKNDSCNPSGKSYLWAAKYDTGGEAGALLKGKAILQVSTGAIEQIDMSTAFSTHGDRLSPDGSAAAIGNRVTSSMNGVPPVSQGLSILSSPPPVKKTMHFRER